MKKAVDWMQATHVAFPHDGDDGGGERLLLDVFTGVTSGLLENTITSRVAIAPRDLAALISLTEECVYLSLPFFLPADSKYFQCLGLSDSVCSHPGPNWAGCERNIPGGSRRALAWPLPANVSTCSVDPAGAATDGTVDALSMLAEEVPFFSR